MSSAENEKEDDADLSFTIQWLLISLILISLKTLKRSFFRRLMQTVSNVSQAQLIYG